MQGVQGLLANPNPQGVPIIPIAPGNAPMVQNFAAAGNSAAPAGAAGQGMGVLNGGSIAGVASLARGSSIKTVNDQQDYSLWEFYYDPTKDTSAIAGGSGINPLNGAPQPFGLNNNNINNANSSSGSTSAVGPSPAQPTTPNPPPNPPQQP
jgi:hypothetical protein